VNIEGGEDATRPVEEIADLDRLVHEPARLAILTALSVCRWADFPYLVAITGLTHGNLSSHLAKLEAADLIVVEKAFRGRVPATTASITARGSAAIEVHWQQLERLRRESERFVRKSAPRRPASVPLRRRHHDAIALRGRTDQPIG
jgi:DNA-binding transcriptional ArsR family regulator